MKTTEYCHSLMVSKLVLSACILVSLPFTIAKSQLNTFQGTNNPKLAFVDYSRISSKPTSFVHLETLLKIRGGRDYMDEDEYDEDEYDEEEEDDDYDDAPRRQSRPPYDHRMNRPNAPGGAPRRGPPPNRPKTRRPKHWTQRAASQTLKTSSNLAWNAVKQPGKMAYHLIRPKYVDEREIEGLWRLDQQVTMGSKLVASVATIQMEPRRHRITFEDSQTKEENDEKKKGPKVAPYRFTKTRLGSYKMEFIAPLFLVGETPRLYGYKGTWQRKLADKNVIKLVGKIYKVKKPRFGKGSYQFVGSPVGTFVARRRVQLDPTEDDDEYDEYDDDEYDIEDEDVYDEDEY